MNGIIPLIKGLLRFGYLEGQSVQFIQKWYKERVVW